MTDFVTRFPMGSDIPEWLLVADPEQPGAPRGHFRFRFDVDVIDTPNYYVIMPNLAMHPNGATAIDNTGMAGHRIAATSKPVMDVIAGGMFLDSSATPQFKELERQAKEAQERHVAEAALQATYAPPAPTPDPHRTFWQRLRYVFTGR